LAVTLDRQVVSRRCKECGIEFVVVRGSLYENARPVGLYLVALHGHSPHGPIAHLAVALRDPAQALPLAAAMDVHATEQQYGYRVVDWLHSPWRGEDYLGRKLDRAAMLSSSLKDRFFHMTDHLTRALPEIGAYFES
jgi:hypothetical protein